MRPEFDRYAADYDQLLKHPVRDFFGGSPGFFHERKWGLIQDLFSRHAVSPAAADWLDVGCGRGELLALGAPHFRSAVGCDPSPDMQKFSRIATVHQPDPVRLPFLPERFDFVTAVCVYHHVQPAERPSLTREIYRVLRPGGTALIVEHNPFNPVTRLIVRCTPVDAEAILLRSGETAALLRTAGFDVVETQYFLYLPAFLFRFASGLERLASDIPLGGQYALWARKPR